MNNFATLELSKPLNEALDQLGYKTPTPIQKQAIPVIRAKKDLLGLAQTGTGKTAAFALPILDHLYQYDREPPKKGCRVLILAPTRELVAQISNAVRDYGSKMPHLSVVSVFGGVSILRHIKRLSGKTDIVVATPGRLIDLIQKGAVKLGHVEVLVLDEADQMMDMGFIHALRQIVPHLPVERQTLLFSATMVTKVKRLAEQFLNAPEYISVTPPNSTADNVTQHITYINKDEKLSLLALCLLEPDVKRAIVFTRTKYGADRVVKQLRKVGIDSRAIHGNKTQGQRKRALQAFCEGDVNILIATDIAARGIDIPEVSHVFNYEIPNVAEQYVHRIGRTARANRSGVAHGFVAKDERAYLKNIQKLLGVSLPVKDLPEDFIQKTRTLKTRQALPNPEKPKQGHSKGQTRNAHYRKRVKANRKKGAQDKLCRSDDERLLVVQGDPSVETPKQENKYKKRKKSSQKSKSSSAPKSVSRSQHKDKTHQSEDGSSSWKRSPMKKRRRKPSHRAKA